MKVSRVSEMRAMDRTAIEKYRISAELLMENAGHAAYFALRNEFGVQNKRFLFFCGLGNNGGDGFVLKVAQSMDIETYVSTRSKRNIERARRAGAVWAADSSKEEMPSKLDAAILFPPAGNMVEPILSQLNPGGDLVMAAVSSSMITIEHYSANLWGRAIKTLYQLRRSDAEEFIELANDLDLRPGVSLFAFEELDEALILAKQNKLDQPNAVIVVRPQ